jgi:hypothetical protein
LIFVWIVTDCFSEIIRAQASFTRSGSSLQRTAGQLTDEVPTSNCVNSRQRSLADNARPFDVIPQARSVYQRISSIFLWKSKSRKRAGS